jgi:Bacterial regulatory proteins, tetR family
MNRPVRTGKDSDEARARILEAAEQQFRRVGYHRTSVADIAAELGMSAAGAQMSQARTHVLSSPDTWVTDRT